MRKIIIILSVICLPLYVVSQAFLNLDMEYFSNINGYPNAWIVGAGNYHVLQDTIIKVSGKSSVLFKHGTKGNNYGGGYIYQALPKDMFAGKKSVTISVNLKTSNLNKGNVEFYSYTFGAKNIVISIDTTNVIRSSKDWGKYTIKLPIDSNVLEVRLGVSDDCNGDLWIDNFEINFDGENLNNITLSEPSHDEIAWLKQNITPFKYRNREMRKIDRIKDFFKDAEIVGLGECTHGSREVFLTKNSIIKYLVQNEGFNVVAFEANLPECDRINDYVMTGQGDPKKLLKGIYFWTWNTQEVLDLIKWLKKYNAKHKKKVYFTGIDMQHSEIALENILSFSSKDEKLSQLVKDFKLIKNKLDTFMMKSQIFQASPENISKPMLVVSEKIFNYCDSLYKQLPTDMIFNKIRQNAKILLQYSQFSASMSTDFRDKCMAENTEWISNSYIPNSKIIIWAHNAHINKKNGTLGGFLSKRFGKSYKNIGFTIEQGTYTAVGNYGNITSHPLIASETGSYEYYFKKINVPCFFINLDKVDCSNKSAKWLCNYKYARDIGAMYSNSQFTLMNYKELFDGIIYINKTTNTYCFDIEEKSINNHKLSYKISKKSNFDFKKIDKKTNLPEGWCLIGSNYEMRIDTTIKHNGNYSLMIKNIDGKQMSKDAFGGCKLNLANTFKSGEIELSGYVKAENVDGFYGLWLRIDGNNNKVLCIDNMANENLHGTHDWLELFIKLPLTDKAKYITVGGIISGKGKIWLDNLRLLVNGKDVNKTK